MRFDRHRGRSERAGLMFGGGLRTAISGALLLGLAYVAVTSIPELVRYLRIRRM